MGVLHLEVKYLYAPTDILYILSRIKGHIHKSLLLTEMEDFATELYKHQIGDAVKDYDSQFVLRFVLNIIQID